MHVNVTEKGQITIPVAARRALGIQPGDSVSVTVNAKDKQLLVRKSKTLDDLFGMLGKPPNGRSLAIEDIDDAIGDAISEHVMSSLRPKKKRRKK